VIPELNDVGYLPPGVHSASLDEIAARFGQESEIRQAQMDSIRWLVEMAKKDMKLTQTHSVEEAAARHGVKYGKRAKW